MAHLCPVYLYEYRSRPRGATFAIECSRVGWDGMGWGLIIGNPVFVLDALATAAVAAFRAFILGVLPLGLVLDLKIRAAIGTTARRLTAGRRLTTTRRLTTGLVICPIALRGEVVRDGGDGSGEEGDEEGDEGNLEGRHLGGVVVMWRCGVVVMWRCGVVVMWRCGVFVMWRCGVFVMWRFGCELVMDHTEWRL